MGTGFTSSPREWLSLAVLLLRSCVRCVLQGLYQGRDNLSRAVACSLSISPLFVFFFFFSSKFGSRLLFAARVTRFLKEVSGAGFSLGERVEFSSDNLADLSRRVVSEGRMTKKWRLATCIAFGAVRDDRGYYACVSAMIS